MDTETYEYIPIETEMCNDDSRSNKDKELSSLPSINESDEAVEQSLYGNDKNQVSNRGGLEDSNLTDSKLNFTSLQSVRISHSITEVNQNEGENEDMWLERIQGLGNKTPLKHNDEDTQFEMCNVMITQNNQDDEVEETPKKCVQIEIMKDVFDCTTSNKKVNISDLEIEIESSNNWVGKERKEKGKASVNITHTKNWDEAFNHKIFTILTQRTDNSNWNSINNQTNNDCSVNANNNQTVKIKSKYNCVFPTNKIQLPSNNIKNYYSNTKISSKTNPSNSWNNHSGTDPDNKPMNKLVQTTNKTNKTINTSNISINSSNTPGTTPITNQIKNKKKAIYASVKKLNSKQTIFDFWQKLANSSKSNKIKSSSKQEESVTRRVSSKNTSFNYPKQKSFISNHSSNQERNPTSKVSSSRTKVQPKFRNRSTSQKMKERNSSKKAINISNITRSTITSIKSGHDTKYKHSTISTEFSRVNTQGNCGDKYNNTKLYKSKVSSIPSSTNRFPKNFVPHLQSSNYLQTEVYRSESGKQRTNYSSGKTSAVATTTSSLTKKNALNNEALPIKQFDVNPSSIRPKTRRDGSKERNIHNEYSKYWTHNKYKDLMKTTRETNITKNKKILEVEVYKNNIKHITITPVNILQTRLKEKKKLWEYKWKK